ncbi:MAG: CD225/dispanin family protein [Clostridiaceae bacterium]|nr:CD225/dispanin family protein [Clostridiaceae bacterium]
MFCHKCGKENSEDASYCNSCGEQLKEETINISEKVPQTNNNIEEIRSPLVWSILVTIFGALTCCCLNPISLVLGIISIVFSTQIQEKQRRGDFDGAKRDARSAVILNWVGLGFIILTIIIVSAIIASGAFNNYDYPTRL